MDFIGRKNRRQNILANKNQKKKRRKSLKKTQKSNVTCKSLLSKDISPVKHMVFYMYKKGQNGYFIAGSGYLF